MKIKRIQWKEEISEEQILDYFIEDFEHDLEEWFSAVLCCCDKCIYELKNKWPGIHVCTDRFERHSIDLHKFYEGSYLQDNFSKEEFDYYIEKIKCPRCGRNLSKNDTIYPFNFDFIIDEYEQIVDDAFRLIENKIDALSNTFIKRIHDAIYKSVDHTLSMIINEALYHGRKISAGDNITETDYLKYPPKTKSHSTRYSKEGVQALYLADSPQTCYFEIRMPSDLAVGEIRITKQVKVLDLTLCSDEIFSVLSYSFISCNIQNEDESFKKYYLLSQAVAMWAKSAGFDAIKYFSVRNHGGVNYVFLNPEAIWPFVEVSNVCKYKYIKKWR